MPFALPPRCPPNSKILVPPMILVLKQWYDTIAYENVVMQLTKC